MVMIAHEPLASNDLTPAEVAYLKTADGKFLVQQLQSELENLKKKPLHKVIVRVNPEMPASRIALILIILHDVWKELFDTSPIIRIVHRTTHDKCTKCFGNQTLRPSMTEEGELKT